MARSRANVIDISTQPKVSQLLGQIEELSADSGADSASSSGRSARERAVAELYLEVGRYVHWLTRQDPAAVQRIADEGRRWAAETDKRLGPAPSIVPSIPMPAASLPSSRATRSARPRPASAPAAAGSAASPASPPTSPAAPARPSGSTSVEAGPPAAAPSIQTRLTEVQMEPLEDDDAGVLEYEGELLIEPLEAEAAEEPTDSLIATGAQEAPWIRDLHDLLAALGPPERPDIDSAACVAAASRLLNATTQMEVRWMGFPDAVQHGLLGMISCRARGLQQQMEIDVELRMTLGRLRRFHSARGLPAVPALKDEAAPSEGSWTADAKRWWDQLAG